MQIQKGLVKYKDRSDIVCIYGLTENRKQYYFLDNGSLPNGNIIASTVLVEAIDPTVVASSIGVVDQNGNVVVPFECKSIKLITDDLLLVEVGKCITPSVIEANKLRSDPLAATRLVTTPAAIKDNMNAKMGSDGRFIFNDQFSEATIFDINGHNVLGGEFFSFVGYKDDTLFFSKNTADSPVRRFSLSEKRFLDAPAPVVNSNLDVAAVAVSKNEIDNAMVEKAHRSSKYGKDDITADDFELPVVSTEKNETVPSNVPEEKEVKEEVVEEKHVGGFEYPTNVNFNDSTDKKEEKSDNSTAEDDYENDGIYDERDVVKINEEVKKEEKEEKTSEKSSDVNKKVKETEEEKDEEEHFDEDSTSEKENDDVEEVTKDEDVSDESPVKEDDVETKTVEEENDKEESVEKEKVSEDSSVEESSEKEEDSQTFSEDVIKLALPEDSNDDVEEVEEEKEVMEYALHNDEDDEDEDAGDEKSLSDQDLFSDFVKDDFGSFDSDDKSEEIEEDVKDSSEVETKEVENSKDEDVMNENDLPDNSFNLAIVSEENPSNDLVSFDFGDNVNYNSEETKESDEVEDKDEEDTELAETSFHTELQNDLFNAELDNDDIFADSTLHADAISVEVDNEIDVDVPEEKDSLIEDVAATMASLIELNRVQKEKILSYEDKLTQMTNVHKKVVEKARGQIRDIEVLRARVKNYETIVSKLEAKVQILESKVNDQSKQLNVQSSELHALRPQVRDKKELAKVLADAQAFLDQAA